MDRRRGSRKAGLGYTILLGGNAGLVTNPIASTKPPYDPVRDFEPIAVIGHNPTLIEVHPSLPIHSLKELVSFAKVNPVNSPTGHPALVHPTILSANYSKH